MQSRARSLLTDIEIGVLSSDAPLSDVLRKCVMFGGYTKSAALQQWAKNELDGYAHGENKDLPDYRVVVGKLHLAQALPGGLRPVPISSHQLPDQISKLVNENYEIRNGVASIENHIAEAENGFVPLNVRGGAMLAEILTKQTNQPGVVYVDLFISIATTSLNDILHSVRDKLVALVAEIVQTLPDEEAAPSPAAVANAVAVHITGESVGNVTVTTNQASGASTIHAGTASAAEHDGRFWTRGRKLAAFLVGLVTVIAGVVGTFADWGDAFGPSGTSPTPPAASTSPQP